MTKFTRFKMLLLALVMLVGSGNVWSQLLVENFDYTIGSVITATTTADPITGWLGHSGTGTANIDVTSGLTFAGYAGSGVGGAANLDATGQDINKPFTSQTSGTLYAAFMIQTQATNSAGYFAMFGPTPMSTTFLSRVWVNATGSGVGVSGSSAPATYTTITAGTPVLLVLKHDFTTHVSSLYVLSAFSATEPASANTTFTETVAAIGTFGLRQYNAAQRIIVDGLRIATTWAEAVAPASAPSAVVTPTFSPAAGNYYSTQNVTLSTTTEGATIYYTTDGTDPDNTDAVYSTPIAVSATTTIKAKAYKTAMDPSAVATALYNYPTINNVSNIAALRAGATDGTVYKLTGEALLTLKSTTTSNPKFIQDATGGILLFDSGSKISTSYNIGDGITNIMGTLTTVTGMLQFIPVTDPGAATSTGNTLTPVEIDLVNLANYPGQLVKVSGVTITGTGNFAAGTNYNLNASATTILRTQYSDLNYIGQPIPTVPQDIVGVVLMYNTTAEIVPRSLSDFSNTVFASPTILVSEATVPAMTAQVGATDTETITVSGQNLTANIGLAITGTNASLFTLSTYSIAPTSGSVTDQSVTITYTPTAAGSHTATLTLTSDGAESVVKSLGGTATWPPLAAPVADAAGAISQSGFTAIWGTVSGATSYEVSVYTKEASVVNATDLFISEYIEGSSNNKAIEIYNGTGASVDLSTYSLKKQTNGAGIYTTETVLAGTLANNDVYIMANTSSNATILGLADATNNTTMSFNGNDAVALFKSGVQLDEVGVFNQVTDWGINTTLVRKSTVTGPKATYNAADWNSFAIDNLDNLGSHTYGGAGFVSTQISGSPFTVTGETSKVITGLSASSTYYYTVVAKNVNVNSSASNEVSVVTSFGVGLDVPVLKNITAFDGKIRFSATAGQVVEVYNAVGQKLISNTTIDGLNTLSIDARGMLIVKLGNQIAKVIL